MDIEQNNSDKIHRNSDRSTKNSHCIPTYDLDNSDDESEDESYGDNYDGGNSLN